MAMTQPDQPLKGKRVLVTRPVHQAETQRQLLTELGANCVALPLLQIQAITESDPNYPILKQQILDLDLNQHLIVVSANAAHLGFDWIDQYWPQMPIGINWFAIGKRTAQTLDNYGIDAYHSPLGYDSEALLNSPGLQQVEGDKILIFRGEGGREKLAQELRARGAQVSYAELYRRVCPEYNQQEISQALFERPLDAIMISSAEGLQNLLKLAQGNQQFTTQSLMNCHLVVPSLRVKHEAEAAGFKRISTATGPDDQSMVTALLQ